VAQVLKRVAGVTVQDNKYVTVRGMSERYNNVQLNGSSLPSTEPNRRNFSFDIIPSNLIENVTVNKTFTPDLPGEFTGGLVQVNTLSIPNEKFFNISVGTGGNTESTGRDFKTNKRFGADYLFGEKEERVWYAGRQPENFPQSTTNAGQMNHFGFDIYRAIPLQNHALSFGLPFKINDAHTIGLVAAATYRHEETIETLEELHQFDRDSLWRSIAPGKTYKFVTAAGAIANIGWKTRGHAITWRNLFNNRFTHTNMERCMIESYGGEAYLENYSAPTIASLKQTQIDGEHLFFGRKLILTWNADYNTANRTNPDDRFVSGVLERDNILEANVPPLYDGKYKVSWTRIGPSVPGLDKQYLMYNNLNETKKNAAINLEYKFNLLYREQKLKAGYALSSRKSDFQQQYLSAHVGQNGIGSLGGMSLQEFYNPEHFTDGWLVYKTGGFTNRMVDYYDGEQSIDALYLMGEITPLQPLRIIGGIRMENCETEVLTRVSGYEGDQYFNKVDSLLTRSKQDWLPSLTAIYAITPSLNFRAAYSENLARADFRELSPVSYWDVNGRLDIQNVKPLEQSSSRNCDLRLEWYPSPGEVVSLSAFYKDFDKPVEKVVRMYSDKQNFGLLVVNLDRAVMRGLEFNFRKSFAFIAPALENLWLSGNFALMEGLVEAENEIWKIEKRERPLQGLAPYNLNASLMYEGSRFGAAVNYTRVGRTLLYGGEFVKHDVYENPRNVLDLQLYARFFEQRLEVKLNASDVLNEEMITYRNCDYDSSNDQAVDPGAYHSRTHLGLDYNEGDFVMSRISRGINLSVSLSWKF
jgi:TonB-dependent receptor